MADGKLTEALADTFNLSWFPQLAEQEINDSLDALGGGDQNAIRALENFEDPTLVQNPVKGEDYDVWAEGDTQLAGVDVSQNTMDIIAPAVAIAGGEALTRGWDALRMPEGIGPKARWGGSKSISFAAAMHANQIGKDFARETIIGGKRFTEPVATGVGITAAYGTYKGLPVLGKFIAEGIKTGMASSVIPAIAIEAGESAAKEVMEVGGKEVMEKFGRTIGEKFPYPKKGPLSVPTGAMPKHLPGKESVKAASRLIKQQAQQEVSEKLAGEVRKRIGTTASQQWDDVLMRLKNPNVMNRVGKLLLKFAPKTAYKLAGSATATILPEPVSSVLGVAGMTWAAYDIFNLAKEMPELWAAIFEDAPAETVEDSLMNQMAAENTIFPADEQRTPQ